MLDLDQRETISNTTRQLGTTAGFTTTNLDEQPHSHRNRDPFDEFKDNYDDVTDSDLQSARIDTELQIYLKKHVDVVNRCDVLEFWNKRWIYLY